MNYVIVVTPAQRFAYLIDILGQVLGRRSCWRTGGFPLLDRAFLAFIYQRARSYKARFLRYATAENPAALCPRPRPRPPREQNQRPPRPKPPYTMRHSLGWLVKLIPETAQVGSHLLQLLQDPEMAALLKAAPTLARSLRPLCRALGIRTLYHGRPLPFPLKPSAKAGRASQTAATAPPAQRPTTTPAPRPPTFPPVLAKIPA